MQLIIKSGLKTGICLKIISINNPKYMKFIEEGWVNFSKKTTEEFDYDSVISKWNKLYPHSNQLDYNTLESWVKNDNIEEWENYLIDEYGYNKIKKDFNQHVFKTMQPVLYCEFVNDSFVFRRRNDMIEAYENKLYKYRDEKKKAIISEQFIKRWLQDPDIVTYHDANFIPPPLICKPHTYNFMEGVSI